MPQVRLFLRMQQESLPIKQLSMRRGPWHSDICYYCERRGHWKRNCPDRIRDRLRKVLESLPYIGGGGPYNTMCYYPTYEGYDPMTSYWSINLFTRPE